MLKLYYSPGACSLSPHIVLREAGLPFELALASTKTHKLADGTDYYTINPKGYVPLLELADGHSNWPMASASAKAPSSSSTLPTRCRPASWHRRPARWRATG